MGEALPVFDKLWDYSDPAGTEAEFREILPLAEASGNDGYLAELRTQIARCLGLQSRFDEAHRILDSVEAMLERLGTGRARVRYLLERGRVYSSSGNAGAALPLFEEAWRLGTEWGETRLAFDGLHMVAIAQPDPHRQIEWNLKGIEAVGKTPSEVGWLYAFYNNLGEAYHAIEDYASALKAFENMAKLDTDKGNPPELHTRKDIAKMLRKLGRVDEALAILRELEEKNDPWVDEELGECLLAMGRGNSAKAYFRRAYVGQKDDPWVQQHEGEKLQRLCELGN